MIRKQIIMKESQVELLKAISLQERKSFSELVREFLDLQIRNYKMHRMSQAARALYQDYQNDQELNSFLTLDGEGIYEKG
ncbi:MAG: hypothetical protein MUO76_01845 [Anaerolineaceae bacterium]|nr:hypothetical protein [Anaerolineaceae bacterium]